MKVTMLVPSYRKVAIAGAVQSDAHPDMDYDALERSLVTNNDADVTFVDFAALDACKDPRVLLVTKLLGQDAGLAALGFFHHSQGVDCIFSNSESISMPLSLMFRMSTAKRPGHVVICHRLSTGKKQLFFNTLKVHKEMDRLFVYADIQRKYGTDVLGIPAEKLTHIHFHADTDFYRPDNSRQVDANQISAAGLEWRDYPTLIGAAKRLDSLDFRLAAASPWSKHTNETERTELPANVAARRYEYGELRELYGSSAVVACPLYETDFQAGITSILEAMAMGCAVVATRTTGQTDVIEDGVTGLYVDPGDVDGWCLALERLTRDTALRESLGANARAWILNHASLALWVRQISSEIAKFGVASTSWQANCKHFAAGEKV